MRILFCGLGSIGQRHLRNLRQLLGDELQVHAYRVRGQRIKLKEGGVEEGADLERDYGVVVHESLAQALASNPDAAFICNPNSLHVPVALACAHAGVAIFMEKPLASELEGIAELDALVREKNLLFHVGYNYRFHPGLQRIKTLVQEGFFGRLLTARGEIGEHLPDWHRYEDYRQMYASRAVQGGGVIRSQIHEMDVICWLFGLPLSIVTHGGQLSNLEIDVEDTASSLMRCSGEAGSFPILLHQDFLQRPAVRTFKVVGDSGVAEIDLLANRLRVFDAQGKLCEQDDFPGFVRNDMYLAQTRYFLDCLGSGATPLVSLRDGLQSLRLALAALRSLNEGREVALSEVNIHD